MTIMIRAARMMRMMIQIIFLLLFETEKKRMESIDFFQAFLILFGTEEDRER